MSEIILKGDVTMYDPVSSQLKRVNLLNSEIDAVYHEATLKMGLTDSAMTILYTICLFDGSCQLSQIVALSGLSKQTINSALRKLEEDGVVYLRSGGGRRKLACLTDKGHEVARGTALRLMEIENQVFSEWTAEELEIYTQQLRRFLTSLREKVSEL